MQDFSDALADDSRELGRTTSLYTVDQLTDEMEFLISLIGVVGVTLHKCGAVKDLAYESFNEFTEKNHKRVQI